MKIERFKWLNSTGPREAPKFKLTCQKHKNYFFGYNILPYIFNKIFLKQFLKYLSNKNKKFSRSYMRKSVSESERGVKWSGFHQFFFNGRICFLITMWIYKMFGVRKT